LPESELPRADAVCDGGDLDCGSGLLLIIREAMAPLAPRGVLEVRSRESSVAVDLPAWCRMVGHELLEALPADGGSTSYFLAKAQTGDGEYAADRATARDFEWTVRVRANAGMQARAYARNHAITVGQPASFDTEDAAPSALEYLLSSLAGCLAVGFQWRASRSGIEVFQLEVSLHARADNILVFLGLEETGHPGLAAVDGKLFVDADGEEERLRAIWEETVLRSPVTQSLVRTVGLNVEFRRA
jgi:uncharacterized OsmC-like protein/TusA-related sulfurtransferase